MLSDIANSGAIPTLEALIRFSGARQRIIAHNIANMATPNFIQRDVSVQDFQKSLDKAVSARRTETGGMTGPLQLESSQEVAIGADDRMSLDPQEPSGGILFHDRNNRDFEQLMKANAENVGVFRISAELLRSRMQQIRDAIAERVA